MESRPADEGAPSARLIARRLPAVKRAIAAAAFLSTVAIAFCGLSELMIRLAFSRSTNYGYEMWRYAALMKQSVPDARGHVHIPDRAARLMGVDVRINSQGLRGDELYFERNPAVVRLIAIGDSFTFGWGVREEDTFSKLLEARFKNLEVINAGVGNYNTEQELAAYKIDYSRYGADWILLCFYINDAEPAQEGPSNEMLGFLMRHSALFALASGAFSQLKTAFDPRLRFDDYYRRQFEGESWEKYQQTIRAFAAAVRADQARRRGERPLRWMVAILPDLRNLENYPFVEAQKKIAAAFAREGAATIDLRTVFVNRPSSVYWVAPDDPHPNAFANRTIADALYDALRRSDGRLK